MFQFIIFLFINKKCTIFYKNKNNISKEYFLLENILLIFGQNYSHGNADVI